MKFRKKPVVIEATQWFKHGDHENVLSVDPENSTVCWYAELMNIDKETIGCIETLEGPHFVTPGDWIITGVEGEQYPCKPEIFEKTYEKVEE